MEVAAGAQLREDRERQHLDAATEEVVGRQRLVAHLAEVLRARIGHVDHHLRGDLRSELEVLVEHVPPGRVEELGQQLVGSEALRALDEAGVGPDALELVPVALAPGALARELELDQPGRHDLEEPEVQERDAAVGE